MSSTTTFDISGEQVTADLLWRADFSDESAFLPECEGGSVQFHDDGLEIDCTDGKNGVTIWYPRAFPENVLIEFTATCHEVEGDEMTGRNLNLFFAGAGAEGEADLLAETERTGAYSEYHELPNYIFTFTYLHSRMRRDPGFEKRSEFSVGAQSNHSYDIQVLKRSGEIGATIDGRLVHHWRDDDPHGSGWVGLRTWNTHLTYDDWAVYEP